MAPDTDSPRNERRASWRCAGPARVSLTPRILAVNIFALALLAGGFFYLDSLSQPDRRQPRRAGEPRGAADRRGDRRRPRPSARDLLALQPRARHRHAHPPVSTREGKQLADSRALGLRNFVLRDPDKEPWGQSSRALPRRGDRHRRRAPPRAPLIASAGRRRARLARRAHRARAPSAAPATVWRAPDRTPVITAAAALLAERRGDDHGQCARHHPDGARRAVPAERRAADRDRSSRSCCRCSSRARSCGRCAGWRAPRSACGWAARARWWCRACPRAATRSACSPARCPT